MNAERTIGFRFSEKTVKKFAPLLPLKLVQNKEINQSFSHQWKVFCEQKFGFFMLCFFFSLFSHDWFKFMHYLQQEFDWFVVIIWIWIFYVLKYLPLSSLMVCFVNVIQHKAWINFLCVAQWRTDTHRIRRILVSEGVSWGRTSVGVRNWQWYI
jgi:hypothetical protein